MASQGVAANSRLAEMQMRFQRKQMLEREQKKMALTGVDTTSSDTSITPKTIIGNGKVRQMFDDRRRGIGIDRSHPLKPITTSTSVPTKLSTQQTSTTKRQMGGASTSRRPVIVNSTLKKSQALTTHNSLNKSYSSANDNGNFFDNDLDELDYLENETFPKEFSSLSLNDTLVMESHITANREFDNNGNEESSILGGTIVINKKTSPKANGIKLKPVITRKSPTAMTTTKSNIKSNRNVGNNNKMSPSSRTPTSTARSPLQKTKTPQATKNVRPTGTKTNNAKPATFALSVKPPPRITTPPPGMAACQYCHRHFNEERIVKHEEVCKKMTSKKRKIFDASTHRVKGTEAEKYLRKGKISVTSAPKPTVSTAVPNSSQGSVEKKSNWRKKHEEFIAAIREAKKVQAYLAKGGKLSDLPPPPPSENPDYIQCPHCGRRFNESAAERHIPKCANMKHNKPKPPGANVQKKRF